MMIYVTYAEMAAYTRRFIAFDSGVLALPQMPPLQIDAMK